MPAGGELIIEHHAEQDNETDEEIDKGCYLRSGGDDQPGEVNFADEAGVADEAVGGFAQGV